MPVLGFVPLMVAALAPGGAIAVTPESLADLPSGEVMLNDHGTVRRCEGPRLRDVLARADVPQGEDLRGAALAQGVRVVARDGYTVLLSLGEIDPMLGKNAVILATRCDGVALDDAVGPVRMIVPGDDRPARAVRQVERLERVGVAGE